MIVFVISYRLSCACVHVHVVEICGSSFSDLTKVLLLVCNLLAGQFLRCLGSGAKRATFKNYLGCGNEDINSSKAKKG